LAICSGRPSDTIDSIAGGLLLVLYDRPPAITTL
jgi:hypothetical protein